MQTASLVMLDGKLLSRRFSVGFVDNAVCRNHVMLLKNSALETRLKWFGSPD